LLETPVVQRSLGGGFERPARTGRLHCGAARSLNCGRDVRALCNAGVSTMAESNAIRAAGSERPVHDAVELT
jgi:hypothetical protein